MPSSLIVVALVVAWLVVLVPMIVRKRQEIARTADSALAARVVRSGAEEDGEEGQVHEEELDADQAEPYEEPPMDDLGSARRYRPGRGGFDPEAAAVIAKAKYGFRQRVVLAMLVGAVVTAVLAGMVFPLLWSAHLVIDFTLISYLVYLRRQVRIEQEIRERRQARMGSIRRSHARPYVPEHDYEDEAAEPEPDRRRLVTDDYPPQSTYHHPGAVIVDVDDEDPAFDELESPGTLPYRRAVGE